MLDCFIPYYAYKCFIMPFSKTSAIITMYSCQYAIHIKPFIHEYFAKVIAFWLMVRKAWLNFEKVQVRTKMSSLPSLKGMILIKSIHNRSIRLLVTNDSGFCIWTCIKICYNLALWTLMYIFGNATMHWIPIKALSTHGNSSFGTLMTLILMNHGVDLCVVNLQQYELKGCTITVEVQKLSTLIFKEKPVKPLDVFLCSFKFYFGDIFWSQIVAGHTILID